MLFLYFISLFYFTQLTSCQITSESEAINKIIGNILLKAERKNAESSDSFWGDYFEVTDKAKHFTRSPKKLIDFNPFVRTQHPRSKPTLMLYDILPALKTRQGLKNDERTFDGTPKTEIKNGNHNSGEKQSDTKTTFSQSSVKEYYGTTSSITNFVTKLQGKTTTPVNLQPIPNEFVPDRPQDKMVSDSLFTTPQSNDVPQDAFTSHESTAGSGDLLFDKMQSTPPLNTINGIKIFGYSVGKTTSKYNVGSYPYSLSTPITLNDLKSLQDVEDLISSVPNYEKPSESIDDFLKRVTEPGYKYFDTPDLSFQNTNFYNDIEDATTDVTENTNRNKLKNEFGTINTVVTEEPISNDFKLSTPTRYTVQSDPLDMSLWPYNKDKPMKAIISSPYKDNELNNKENEAEWSFKTENYGDNTLSPETTYSDIEQAKLLSTEESHIVDTLSPFKPSTSVPTDENKISENNNKMVMNDKKSITTEIQSDQESTKAEQFGKIAKEPEKALDYTTPKTAATQSDVSTEKVNTAANKKVFAQKEIIKEKEINSADKKIKLNETPKIEKESKVAVTKTKLHDTLYGEKESKVVDKLTQVHEPQLNDKEDGRKAKVVQKVEVDIPGKEIKKLDNNVVDKETSIQNVKGDKHLKESSSISTKTAFTDKKNNIVDNKKDNSNKKSSMADLYDDILKIYGSIKETTEKAPQKIQDQIAKHLNWESVKRFFGHDRVCNCKCRANKTLCKACAASDAVMRELTFEFNNLADYMKAHCTEIQTFFWMNPSGGKRLRDTVHRIDKSMQDYYKRVRGKCTGKKCNTFATYLDRKRYVDKKKNERKYLLELLRDLEISDV